MDPSLELDELGFGRIDEPLDPFFGILEAEDDIVDSLTVTSLTRHVSPRGLGPHGAYLQP